MPMIWRSKWRREGVFNACAVVPNKLSFQLLFSLQSNKVCFFSFLAAKKQQEEMKILLGSDTEEREFKALPASGL